MNYTVYRHRSNCRLSAVAVLLSVCCHAPASGTAEDAPTVDQMLQRMEDYEKAIPNCILKGSYTGLMRKSLDMNDSVNHFRGTFRFVYRRPDSIRFESLKIEKHPRPGLEGEDLRSLRIGIHHTGRSVVLGADNGVFSYARISKGHGPFETPFVPASLIRLCQYGIASQYVRQWKFNASNLTVERLAGRDVAVFRSNWHTNNDGWKSMMELKVDLARNCLPFLYVWSAQAPGDTRSFEQFRFSVDEFREVQPGIWMGAAFTQHHKMPNGRNSSDYMSSLELRIDEHEIEPRIPESTFDLKIPPGVMVKDEISGRSYQSFAVNPEAVKLDSAEIRALRERLDRFEAPPIRNSEEGSRSLLLVGTIGALALVIGLAVYWAKRRWA